MSVNMNPGGPNPASLMDFKGLAVLLGDVPAQISIASAALVQLSLCDPKSTVNRVILDMRSASFSGTITIKGRARSTTDPFVAIPYNARKLNGTAGISTGITTGITDATIADVDATGLDIALDTTAAYTSGTMTVDIDPMLG